MSETTKISISQALAEIANLKKIQEHVAKTQLSDSHQEFMFVMVSTGKNKVANSTALVADAEKLLRANFQRFEAGYDRAVLLKSLVAKSNAETTVKIGDKEVTVVEAIKLKEMQPVRKAFLRRLRMELIAANRAVEQANKKVEDSITDFKKTALSGDNANSEAVAAQVKLFEEKLREESAATLIDPMKLSSKIDELERELNFIETQLDFKLSESNATTYIEVPV